jgi:outer membrane protein assembly factor BamB
VAVAPSAPRVLGSAPGAESGALTSTTAALMGVGSIALLVLLLSMLVPLRTWRGRRMFIILVTLMLPATSRADWPTSRGNSAHTGTDDNQPGPRQPKVRWVYKEREHFLASPVPAGRALYVSALAGFNAAKFYALALDGNAPERVMWSKKQPFIPIPMVAAPAVVDGLVIFGDGMHQTDGATLYCMHAETGRPIWKYPFPGKLVHLEGSPTIANGHVFVGGGNAGVISVDINKITFEGNVLNAEAVRFIMDKKWADMNAKYAEDVKKNDLAPPPNEDDLPKPQPKLLWQKGKDIWHVDAAVELVGDKLIAASAYVDEDKAGKRVLECLNAADGSTIWETPLDVNPWGGPTVAGDLVLVGCSNIRFDKKLLGQAKGQIVAVELATGKVRWKKDVAGGVLSPPAVSGGLAVFTATDGHIYAWDAATGAEKWIYDAKTPFFGGPAVSGGIVYAADLKGTVHALQLADGKLNWTFDVTGDPAVASPAMVFSSPVVHGGELFVATNRLEGELSEQPLAVVCLSDQGGTNVAASTAKIIIDKEKKTITIPSRISPRKMAYLKETYPLEVVACWPHPLGQKAHETVVNFDAKPSDIHNAMVSLGLKPGRPARGDGKPVGPEVDLFLIIPGLDGKSRAVPLEKAMVEPRTGKPIPRLKWIFTGSIMRQPDPDKPAQVYGADLTGTLISIVPVTDETVFQTNLTMKEEPLLKLEDNVDILPPEGTPVELVIQVR